MWDLQRNGGSVTATTERILGGRGLDPVRRRKVNPAGPMTNIETGTAVISTPSANPRFVFDFHLDACSPKGC
jgi:coupling of ubiquitin conjugation to ER degradation protein 1